MKPPRSLKIDVRVPPGGSRGTLTLKLLEQKTWDSLVVLCTLRFASIRWQTILVIDLRWEVSWAVFAGKLARLSSGRNRRIIYDSDEGSILRVICRDGRYYLSLDNKSAFQTYPLLVEWEEDMRSLMAWALRVKEYALPLTRAI